MNSNESLKLDDVDAGRATTGESARAEASSERRYRVHEELIERSVGEDLLVHRFDTDDVFVLNPHARVVLAAVRSEATHDGVRRVVAEQGFGGDRAMNAVDQAIDELLRLGLILPTGV